MQHAFVSSVASALMILVLGTSVSACIAGWGTSPATSCARLNPLHGPTERHTTSVEGPACGHVLTSLPGRCGLRSFAQFQFVALRKLDIHAPLRPAADKLSAPPDSGIVISSIGSPETDRGPPRS